MKRSWLKRKTPLRAKKNWNYVGKPLKRTKLNVKGHSETSFVKQEIQDVVREIVIIRDGGCVLKDIYGIPQCNGYRKDGELVLQADHLITRANSATYADTRLIVCLCKGHHGWKEFHKEEYDNLLKELLPIGRVRLWEKCQKDSWRPKKTGAFDWKLQLVALRQELSKLNS